MKRIFIILAFLTIILLTTAVYLNSFSVPFQFDDVKRIVDIRAAQVLDVKEAFQHSKSRSLLYLSFALNFYFGQQDVFGYHLLNLAIHIITSSLVFLLCLSVFRSPGFACPDLKKHGGILALFSALIFALHPLQTQAVTYIWQRGESMAAMFYLLALFLYAKFRLRQIHSPAKKGGMILYAACLISIALSSLTKATASTLPVAILLYEVCFLSKDAKEFKIALRFLAPILIFTIFPLLLAKFDIVESKGVAVRFSSHYAPYYYTKLRVLANALRLIVLPINQRVEYDFAWSTSLGQPISTFYSLIFHLCLIGLAIISFKRRPLVSFVISWFYLTLIGTTILFLDDLFFEHYLYPTLFAFALVVPVATLNLAQRMRIDKRWWAAFLIILLAIYSVGTIKRNNVWQTEISLWEDAVRKSPYHARSNYTLGVYYFKARRYDDALRMYRLAMQYKPDYPEAYYRLGEYYFALGDAERSVVNYKKAIEIDPEFFEAHLNLGSVYLYLKRYAEAETYFNNAMRFTDNPDYRKKIAGVLEEIKHHE